jgi:predicted nucleic acid-binding protein
MIVLDTNVVSARTKAAPDPAVVSRVNAVPIASVFLSAVGQAEILPPLGARPGGKAPGGVVTGRPHRF